MSKQTFIIGGADAQSHQKAYLGLQEAYKGLDLLSQHLITIEPYKENRSAKQQRLQWLWNTQIGEYLGYTKDEFHEIAKADFAVPILIRDDAEYAEMVAAVKEVRKSGMEIQADALRREIVRLTSTTDFNTKQMTEYLNRMEQFAADKGANITFPADIANEALGRK